MSEHDMEDIKIKSTSTHSAECDPIIIRDGERTRLVFLPTLVDNPHNKYACLKGTFVYQRKKQNDEWENLKELDLSKLRAGEGVKLDIKSEELHHFLKKCADLYRIYKKEGIPYGKYKYVKLSEELHTLGTISEAELKQFLEINKTIGIDAFNRLIKWIAEVDQTDEILEKMKSLEVTSLRKLNSIIGLSSIKKCIDIWEANKLNADEEFWQNFLRENYFVLSNIFPYPVILVKDKAYIGGKTIHNTGGNLVDFLFQNEITGNAVLIEIKTPCTPILGSLYRTDIYNTSEDLSGALLQAENYLHTFSKEYYNVAAGKGIDMKSFKPNCVVIVGNAYSELTDERKQKSFELFRGSLRNIQIMTYDELFSRVKGLVSLLEG